MHDLLGLSLDAPPKFVRQYLALGEIVGKAARMYADDVKNQKFPSERESY